MRRYIILLVISGLLSNSCVERIDLFSGATPTLVVDGIITNESGPHTIRISFSTAFNEVRDYSAVEGANVFIVDDSGIEEKLNYIGNGDFRSSDQFKGEIGKSYQLNIELNSGKKYESSFEKITPVAPIDKIDYEIEDDQIVFSIDFEDNFFEKNYYRWRYEGTYQVFAPETQNPLVSPEQGGRCAIFGNKEADCWPKDFDREYLNVSDDKLFNGEKRSSFEIYRRVKEDVRFAIGYSSLIEQYSISKEAFDFWLAIANQLDNNGSIFDTSNYLITGNVKDVNDPDVPVLGYFGASAISSKRVFIQNSTLSFEYEYNCEPVDDESCIPVKCTDCRKHSGSSTSDKPDFWPI